MPDMVLSEAQQRALRSLIAAEPVPGSPLPSHRLLEQLAVLIPCKGIGVSVADATGHHPDIHNGPDLVRQLALDHRGKPFTENDVAILHLLEPVFERLFCECPTPHLPAHLTVQERRVLQLVATGRSNAQIAERMGIASSTVRKHLEHVFPKLGVTNRLAAAMVFERRGLPASDPEAVARRYA